jgi:hypothetical protein
MEIDTIESFLFGQCYSPETVIRTTIVASERQLCNFALALRNIGTAELPLLFIGRIMNTIGLFESPYSFKISDDDWRSMSISLSTASTCSSGESRRRAKGKQSLALSNQPTNRYAS